MWFLRTAEELSNVVPANRRGAISTDQTKRKACSNVFVLSVLNFNLLNPILQCSERLQRLKNVINFLRLNPALFRPT